MKEKITVTQTGDSKWDIDIKQVDQMVKIMSGMSDEGITGWLGDEKTRESAVKILENALKNKINELPFESELMEDFAEIKPEDVPMDDPNTWIEEIDLHEAHWLIAGDKPAALFIPFDKYTTVPAKWQKYMAVHYPKADYKAGQRPKVYIARTTKAREMWSDFTTKNPTAKKVEAIGILSTGGMSDTTKPWDIGLTKMWYTAMETAIRDRMREFIGSTPLSTDQRFKLLLRRFK
jgi:hypothetical protein